MTDYTPVKVVRWNVLHLLLTIAGTQGFMLLTSDSAIFEYQQFYHMQSHITLTCNTSDNVSSIEFRRDDTYVGRCGIFACGTSNESKFIMYHNSEPVGYNIFYLWVEGFEVNDAGFYTCVDIMSSQVSGIQITYAVHFAVTFTPKTYLVSVTENVLQRFRCVTSTCRPAATVMWYLGSTQLTSGIVSSISHDVTSSTLDFTPQKSHQGMRILCQGSIDGPDEPVCRLDGSALSSTVALREGWEFRLNCKSDGNPLPSVSWTHPGHGQASPLYISGIQRTHTGLFRIQARNFLVPSNQQAVNLTKDINVTVDVQYPPDPPSCRVGSTAISSDIVSAIRGNTITIHCSCDSNPPSKYSWSVTGVSTPTSGQSLDLLVQNAITLTLTMENSMQFSNGTTEQGRRESPFDVRVLYPPSSPTFHNGGSTGPLITENSLSVIRGKSVTVACVSIGKPAPSYSSWNGTSQVWTFTANSDTSRTCVASNTLNPTGYNDESKSVSGTLNIKVLYGASITDFAITNLEGRDDVVLVEGSRASFRCTVDSNPGSYIEILKDGRSLKHKSNAQSLTLAIEKSKCEDDGIYMCTGRNVYDPAPAMKTLPVFVKCSPRASTDSPSVYHVTSVTDVPASLTFNLVAYPRPDRSDFEWEKQVVTGNGWEVIHITQNVEIVVSVDRLQTSILFTSVQEVDFGYYRVNVSNELGRTSEVFHLQLQESGPSAGAVIGGAVGGSIGALASIVVVVVILRRKYKDVPLGESVSSAENAEHNAAQTYEDISMTTATPTYDVLKHGSNRLDNSHVYTPLDEPSSYAFVNVESVRKEHPV
ncbi:hemicentin-1-like isoform X2 [Mya arenaria]|uniref:hemicentin-1-like isoform X2 n=1 Tax=Mya arenaria TaxID=6604 RepID=UPI0022E7811E|nr:hemicentin-1-like isoform X2 [Mya arenaria]